MGNAALWRAQDSDGTGALESGTVLVFTILVCKIQRDSEKGKNNEQEFKNIGWIGLRGTAGFCSTDASGQ
jgi:hypothetical protein